MDRPKKNKIAIIGYTAHKELAPWNDDEWELWLLNDLYLDCKIFQIDGFPLAERVRWFQLHNWRALRDWAREDIRPGDELNHKMGPQFHRDPEHLFWLERASQIFPVYTRKAWPELPNCKPYPFDKLFSYFGHTWTAADKFKYWTNSISLMVGMAIMELIPEPGGTPPEGAQIAVYGVDMMVAGSEVNSEYGYQRPSCEHILGYCMGAGIKTTIPDQSELLKSLYVYGDEEEYYMRKLLAHAKHEQEQARITSVNQRTQAREAEMRTMGALSVLERIERGHLPGDDGLHVGQAPIAHGHKIPQG